MNQEKLSQDLYDLLLRQGPVFENISRLRDEILAIFGADCQDEGCPHYNTPHGHTQPADPYQKIEFFAAWNIEPETFPPKDFDKSAEEQGLYAKFAIRRLDGTDLPGEKHYGCCYFVLDLDHDPHAAAAMHAYARACAKTHPVLSEEILAKYPHPADSSAVKQQGTLRDAAIREDLEQVEGCMELCEPEDQQAFYNIRAIVIEVLHQRAAIASQPVKADGHFVHCGNSLESPYQASQPAEAPAGQGEREDVPYMIVFDDNNRKPETYLGRKAALRRYEQISGSWNAHLYVKIDSNSRDCPYPNAAQPVQAPAVPEELVKWLKNFKRMTHDSGFLWMAKDAEKFLAMLAAAPSAQPQYTFNSVNQWLMSLEDGERQHVNTVGKWELADKAWSAARIASQPVPEQPQAAGQARDWLEDASHENGNYSCKCSLCGNFFVGHKRRVICKGCAAQAAPAVPQPKFEIVDMYAFDGYTERRCGYKVWMSVGGHGREVYRHENKDMAVKAYNSFLAMFGQAAPPAPAEQKGTPE